MVEAKPKKSFFQKYKTKLVPLVTFLFFILITSSTVIATEQRKESEKHEKLKDYYKQVYNNWDEYRKEYELQVNALREENLKNMEEAKKQYETLLAEQPNLIAQHTRSVIDTEASGSGSYSLNTSTGTPTKQVITVSKPKSAPKTSAS